MGKPIELKSYRCSDGTIFDDLREAEKHEESLKDPYYQLQMRCEKLEKRLAELESQHIALVAQVDAIRNPFQLNNKETNPFIRTWYGQGDSIKDAVNNLKEVL